MNTVNEINYIKKLIKKLEYSIDDNREFEKILIILKKRYKFNKEYFTEYDIKKINKIKLKKIRKELYKKRLDKFYEYFSWVGSNTIITRIILCRIIPTIVLIARLYIDSIIYDRLMLVTVLVSVFIEFVLIDKFNRDPIHIKTIIRYYGYGVTVKENVRVSVNGYDLGFFFVPMIINFFIRDLQEDLYRCYFIIYILMYFAILIRDIYFKNEFKYDGKIVDYLSTYGMVAIFLLRLFTFQSIFLWVITVGER